MKNKTRNLLITLSILLLLIIPFISGYNKMIGLEQGVATSQANIDTELKRRSDLIPNIVNTVKGYAAQESKVIGDVVDARAKLGGAQAIEDRANADAELSSALSRLLVVVEQYPELKSNENFRDLSVTLEQTENRVKIARQDYNKAISQYNTAIRRFPNNIVAEIFGFDQKEYYNAPEGAEEVPEVDFTK
ncbi:LemA family protein [Clostridium sp.]|jgi:LemA protein|uniref:LemA family protein n=1 Tax=Clostridium sp. TaxID=1506 RepID=UPI0039F546B3